MRFRLGLAALISLVVAGFAQRLGFDGHDEGPEPVFPSSSEFHFIRLEYTDLPQYHRSWGYVSRDGTGSGWWLVDWPDADNHFTAGVQRLTRVDTGDPRHLRLGDDHIFDYPWIYATQTGWWGLTEAEIARLREYLLRGGFLVVDDFWGPEQWAVFQHTMNRVLPGQRVLGHLGIRLGHACSLRHSGKGPHVHPGNAASAPWTGRVSHRPATRGNHAGLARDV